jgi:hypothetical protein
MTKIVAFSRQTQCAKGEFLRALARLIQIIILILVIHVVQAGLATIMNILQLFLHLARPAPMI